MVSLKLDLNTLSRTSRESRSKFRSVEITDRKPGFGVVVVSRRKKLRWEKSKPFHGKGIANLLADKGHDPFVYSESFYNEVKRDLAQDINRAHLAAFKAGQHRRNMIKQALQKAARNLALYVQQQIIDGKLGENTRKRAGLKRSYISRGKIDTKYGNPPPYGILTGRFLEGIRGVYKLKVGNDAVGIQIAGDIV